MLAGSMSTVLALALARIDGGWVTVWQLGLEHGKFRMFDLDFDMTRRNNFYSALAFGFFVYLGAYATGQPSVQRYQATPTVSAARWSLLVRSIATAIGALLFFLVIVQMVASSAESRRAVRTYPIGLPAASRIGSYRAT